MLKYQLLVTKTKKKLLKKNNLIELLNVKRNAYIDAINENKDNISYYQYCRGRKEMIEDIITYISEKI